MRLLLPTMLLTLSACASDYKVGSEAEGEVLFSTTDPTGDDDDDDGPDPDDAGDDDDDAGDDDDDVPAGDDDDDDGEPFRPRDEPPTPFGDVECSAGSIATWLSGELVVFSDDDPVSGVLVVDEAGLYDVYDLSVAESGPSQTNESAFLRVPNVFDGDGHPSPLGTLNCDDDYIALDPDNAGPVPAGSTQYLGTFGFVKGDNEVELHHYCEQYLRGDCTGFHDVAGTPCTSGINSVHFTGQAVCLVRVR